MNNTSDKLSVFISYARSDGSAFAEELCAGLETVGFDPFLDQQDIAAGEDWEARLGHLLHRADTVVFVISPAFVASERCAWEVDKALGLSKRIIPVVLIDVPEAQVPDNLRRLNYIFFNKPNSFGVGLKELSEALRTDVDWVREHTRLSELADRWAEKGKLPALLLRGPELSSAQAWLSGWRPQLPEPTNGHREFIAASDQEEKRLNSQEAERLAEREKLVRRISRANRIWGAISAIMLIGMLAGGYYLTQLISDNESTLKQALEAELRATEEEERAERAEEAVEKGRAENKKLAEELEAERAKLIELAAELQASQGDGATRSLGGVIDELPNEAQEKLEAVQRSLDELEQKQVALGWDIDVFWCAGNRQKENYSIGAQMLEALEREQEIQLAERSKTAGQLGMPLGRLRLRELSEKINAQSGYQLSQMEVRAETKETEQGIKLAEFLTDEIGATVFPGVSGSSTPYYLSVFACVG